MPAEIKGLNEECGVFGVFGAEHAASLTYMGLHTLQHRGQEGPESSPPTTKPFTNTGIVAFYPRSLPTRPNWNA